jgi:amino-acid N-acetyltransferase
VDGNREGALLREVFSRDGLGTMVYVSEHENIRRAESADIPDMLRTMEPYVARGILVPRTAAMVQEKLEDYAVYDVDGFVQGCAALHPFSGNMAEIAAVAVAEGNRRGGVGRRLVQYQMQRARHLGIGRLFLLTTQTSDWFAELGFVRGEVADLPAEKRDSYNRERASLVFVRDLEV